MTTPPMSTASSLTVDEARLRADLLSVERYDLEFDLTGLLASDELRSVSTVTFSCSRPGADSFLDCLGVVEEATLNGEPLPTGYPPNGRIALTGLRSDNVVVVRSAQRETNVGRGVHRAVDALDQSVYVWSSFEPDDARVTFACFDQPDLKARFGIQVTAPAEWTVTSNSGAADVSAGSGPGGEPGSGPSEGTRRWHFADTPPLSTYVPVFNAGPFHEVRSSRGGYDLGLYARRSLADLLDRDAEELFDLTARGLEFYGREFEMVFPQTRYDQVFVPEMGGAMENYGCITYSDTFVYREQPSYAQRELRAVVVLHEMAHMWFGDMVTMQWWDDLWLNESFAEWACGWCATSATEFTDTWAGTLASDKLRAYAADRAPTTHPIRQPIPDTAAAAASFDAITYPKGAAVLKQLVAYVGEDNFVAALAAYFRRYAWQNTTLFDLVHEIQQVSGLDLTGWVEGWLETAGTDELRVERHGSSLALTATSPGARPPLPHRLDVGVYEVDGDQLVKADTLAVRVEGVSTPLPDVSPTALLVVNDDDLTFASVRPDETSLQLLLTRGGQLPTALGRTLAVTTAWDLMFNGLLPAEDFLQCALRVLPAETAESVVEPLLEQAGTVADLWSPVARRPVMLTALADLAIALAAHPAHRLPAVRILARSATTNAQLDELSRLADTTDLRWRRLTRLAELGALREQDVQQLLEEDPNPEGWASAELARAAQPDGAAKQRAWDLTVTQRKIPVDVMRRLGTAFWRPGQADLLAPYRAAYRDGLVEMGASGMQWALAVSGFMFPMADADQTYLDELEAAAAHPDVVPVVRQRMLERLDTLRRMVRSRSA
ncbi:MAG TPA: aminopeptidase N [Propionibacteriaceae bacterium]